MLVEWRKYQKAWKIGISNGYKYIIIIPIDLKSKYVEEKPLKIPFYYVFYITTK